MCRMMRLVAVFQMAANFFVWIEIKLISICLKL